MKALKTILFSVFLILSARSGFTQSLPEEQRVTNVFKLNFLEPGVSYEQKIAQFKTLHFSTYLDFLFSDSDIDGSSEFYLVPSLKVEFRNYYNLNKRNSKGLNAERNSGNYVAPYYSGKYAFFSFYDPDLWVNQVGLVWGFQRNYLSNFGLDFNFGLGYNFDSQGSYYYYSPIDLIINISLGFQLGSKKNALKAEHAKWSEE